MGGNVIEVIYHHLSLSSVSILFFNCECSIQMAFMSKSNYLHVDMRPHIAPRQRVDITLEDEAVESIAKLAVA